MIAVQPSGPADQAGIRGLDRRSGTLGDVIVAADGKPTKTLADLAAAMEAKGVGQVVTITVERGASRVDVAVTGEGFGVVK